MYDDSKNHWRREVKKRVHEVACLNTSDHLPLSVTMDVPTDSIENGNDNSTRIDWTKAELSGAISSFQAAVTEKVNPFIDSMHDNIDSINAEIQLVTKHIADAANRTLPHVMPRKRRFFRDATLKQICDKSKVAWKAWVDAGRPPDGPLYDSKNHWRREVKKRVHLCAAMEERKRVRRREELFRSGSRHRFRAPHKRKSRCSKLKVGNDLISNKEDLLHIWADHFTELSKSRINDTDGLQHLKDKVQSLYNASLSNEEYLLDMPFTTEELEQVIRKLKMRKACGPDGLLGEHLKFGGQALFTWLLKILNCIVELEAIPDIFKCGSITPVYKGGGKDPLDKNSYRGITVASVLAKVLEFLILGRLDSVLLEAGVPHVNQTAYRRHVGCADAIFATQESIAKHLREGSTVHMCLYDLHKAFDSVEFPVLLDRLVSTGVNGKTWRIIKNWYEGGFCRVKLEDQYSNAFPILRGVRQGSVLSPTLFLLVIDPLLRKLESAGLGLMIHNFFVGGFAHADDIRTITNSTTSLNAQLEAVSSFMSDNFLQLNPSKCEIVSFPRQNSSAQLQLSLDGAVLPCNDGAKCLGYVWDSTLSSKPMIEHNVTKARKAFFAYGSEGAFQGAISPLSCRSLVETCVLPILLYGCENWSLCDSSLKALNSFLGELCKRILRLPKWYSNTATMIVMDLPSAEACCLIRKLRFLRRITDHSPVNADTLSSRMLFALSDDIESVCLIRECLELEDHFETKFTHSLLTSISELDEDSRPSSRQIRDQVTTRDKHLLLDKCSSNEDTRLIAVMGRMVSWSKLWDLALNGGPKCVDALRAFVRIISYPSHSTSVCPLCDVNSLDSSLLAHIFSSHTDATYDVSDIFDSLRASASFSVSNSNTQVSNHDIDASSTTHMDTSSNSDSDSDTDFSQFFNLIYPLSTLFTCWF